MTMRGLARRFSRCERGGAAEFALILPLMVLLFVGLMDAGRFLYDVNRGEKATQIGARMAVVTAPIAANLATQSYVGQEVGGVTLNQGDRIPEGALTTVTCTNTTCSSFGYSSAAFTNLLTRMQDIMPSITASNLIVEYSDSGLGYAGNPNGMDISPLVTVRLTNMEFAPTLLFGAKITMPDFAYTLTMEDGQGTGSN